MVNNVLVFEWHLDIVLIITWTLNINRRSERQRDFLYSTTKTDKHPDFTFITGNECLGKMEIQIEQDKVYNGPRDILFNEN